MQKTSFGRPIIVIIRGLPGSGKSYVAASLGLSLSAFKTVLLDPDATDYESSDYKEFVRQANIEGVDPSLHAYRYLRAQARQGILDDNIIIWNQPFTNREVFRKMTAGLMGYAHDASIELRILVVEVNVDEELARQRIEQRKKDGGHGPSINTFKRFAKEYESFADEGFPTIEINGREDVQNSVTAILEQLSKFAAPTKPTAE